VSGVADGDDDDDGRAEDRQRTGWRTVFQRADT
jgi:hypothetical protein